MNIAIQLAMITVVALFLMEALAPLIVAAIQDAAVSPPRAIQALVVVFAATLGGCQSLDSGQSLVDSGQVDDPGGDTYCPIGLVQQPEWLTEWLTEAPEPQAPQDIWERMRSGFKLQDEIGVNPRIERQRQRFVSNPADIESACERGNLYIHYVVERLEERNMPLELALLPVIESAYNPFAYSHSHAVGLWQFIPSTGKHFNLRQTSWYDGRRDITASTNAALDYLSRLHEMFDGDWLLALAAYNAGEGRVRRAIKRNRKLGLPTDYWSLSLPKETQNHVPKFLALSQLVMTPDAYGINLNPIANKPYFEQVAVNRRMDLSHVAAMADIDEDELYLLNPAFKKRITLDGPQHLLVPTDKAELLVASLALMKPQALVDRQAYRLRTGSHLAVNTLKEVSKRPGNRLRVGQTLSIPAQPGMQPDQPLFKDVASDKEAPAPRSYRVKAGDNLRQIAKAHQVEVKDLQRWNQLSGKSALKVGQPLRLQGGSAPTPSSNRERQAITHYKVRKGDSIYLIAKRFKVAMQDLLRWNPRSSSHVLMPGQTLTLYLSER
jgi:membrane-bound lytic murein transglycosylase D